MIQCFVKKEYEAPFGLTQMPRLFSVSRTDEKASAHPRVMHAHDDLVEIVLVRGGESRYFVGGTPYEARRGDLFIFNSRVVHVMGDRDHLYRVVYNLTDNAVKFIEDGGTLRLKVHQEGQLCVFAISNTGIGISAEDLPHVFDRFYKTDRSRSMDKTGAGLGLYIVKNIINLHGGEISVRSGGGETEFEFTLPLAPEQNRQNNA